MWKIKLSKDNFYLLNSELPEYGFKTQEINLSEEQADEIFFKLIDKEIAYVQEEQSDIANRVARLADKFFTE